MFYKYSVTVQLSTSEIEFLATFEQKVLLLDLTLNDTQKLTEPLNLEVHLGVQVRGIRNFKLKHQRDRGYLMGKHS